MVAVDVDVGVEVSPFSPPAVVLGGVVVGVPAVEGVVALPLTVPEPVAPIEDVEPDDEPGDVVLPLAVVSVLVLPVVVDVLGDVLPLRLPEPVVEPVVVEGVVVVLLELVAPVPLVPAPALSLRWQALSEKAAANASATAVSLVFIRNSLIGV